MKKAKILFGMVILVLTMLIFTAVCYADTVSTASSGGSGSSVGYSPYTQTNVQDLGDFYSLKTNIYNLTIDAKIIFVAYKDNKMFKVDQRDYLPQYGTFTNPQYFEIFNVDKDVDYVKVLAFSDFDSIRPLCDAEVIEFPPTYEDEYEIIKVLCTVDASTVLTSQTNKPEKVRITVLNSYQNKYGDEAGEDFTKGTKISINVGATNISSYVGRKAVVYIAYRFGYIDDAYISSFVLEDQNNTIITSDQYEYTTTTVAGFLKVEYRENPSDRNTQSFLVSPTAKIYVNGVESAKTLASELGSFYGKAEFSLNDSSIAADYDTVFITTYKTIVVDSVSTKTSRVTAKNAPSLQYADADNIIRATLYDTNGNKMDWADLKEFDVVSYTTTRNTPTTNIVGYLIDNAVTGMVTEIGDGTVYINDKEYSATYDMIDELYLGDEGTFYTDIMGNIVYFEEAIKEKNYGYVLRTQVNSDFENVLKIRMITSDGKINNYDFETRVRYNGETYRGYDLARDAYANELNGRLITYELSQNGKINELNTATAWTINSNKNDFTKYGEIIDESYFVKSTGSFTTTKSKVYGNKNTKIFCIDGNNSSVIDISRLTNGTILKNASFYDLNEDYNIGVVVAEGGIEYGNDIEYEDGEYPALAIQNYYNLTLDSDGYEIYKLYAYENTVLKPMFSNSEYWFMPPENGSVFIPTFKSDNTLKSIEKIVETNYRLNVEYVSSNPIGTEFGDSTTRVRYYFCDIDSIVGSRVTLDDGTEFLVPDSAKVYVVDGRISNVKNRISLQDINYLEYDRETWEWTDGTNTADSYVMFAREVNGKINDVVLYINYTIE